MNKQSLLDMQIEHCVNELIGIVKHTESFNDNPVKKARQLERNKVMAEKAKATIKEIVKQHSNMAEQQLIGAIYTLEGIVNMNGILRMEPSTKQLRDHLDGLNEQYKKIQDKKEKL